MAIEIKCPQCGSVATFLDQAKGSKEACLICGTVLDLASPAVVMKTPDIRVIEDEVAVAAQIPFATAVSASTQHAVMGSQNLQLASSVQPSEMAQHEKTFQAPAFRQNSRRSWAEQLGPDPDERRFPWKALALSFIAFLLVAAAVTVYRVYFYELPADREALARESIRALEKAEFAYYQKTGEFARRISGPVGTLQSRELISADIADAEAPVNAATSGARAAKALRGYEFRILTAQRAAAAPSDQARSFLDARQRMTGGFALLAFPVDASLAKTAYLRDADGTVYAKTVSTQTLDSVIQLETVDLDGSWKAEK